LEVDGELVASADGEAAALAWAAPPDRGGCVEVHGRAVTPDGEIVRSAPRTACGGVAELTASIELDEHVVLDGPLNVVPVRVDRPEWTRLSRVEIRSGRQTIGLAQHPEDEAVVRVAVLLEPAHESIFAIARDTAGRFAFSGDPMPIQVASCDDDADCATDDPCRPGTCEATGFCSVRGIPDCCVEDADCGAPSPCVVGTCVDGLCEREVDEDCCAGDGACDDGNPNTGDRCEQGGCVSGPIESCESGAECDDDNPCTFDRCMGLVRSCVSIDFGGCCQHDHECRELDGDPCTAPACVALGCVEVPVDGCGDAGVGDAGVGDVGLGDVGVPDGGVDGGGGGRDDATAPDAGRPDAEFPDAGRPDAAFSDAGGPDAAFPDAGGPDAAFPDAGRPDAAFPDAGRPDAAFPDAAPRDATSWSVDARDAGNPDGAPLRVDGGAPLADAADLGLDAAAPALDATPRGSDAAASDEGSDSGFGRDARPVVDSALSPPIDAAAVLLDSASPAVDAASPAVDAASAIVDVGTPAIDGDVDGGATLRDGSPTVDAGSPADDAEPPVDATARAGDAWPAVDGSARVGEVDAAPDVGPTPTDDPGGGASRGCECDATGATAPPVLWLLLAVFGFRRRRRPHSQSRANTPMPQ
jgi:MYXO-CTERM domain-containing protein